MTDVKRTSLEGLYGSVPGVKPREVAHFRARTFKSGNSLALRLPAGLGLEPGVEMELRVEDGQHYEFWPIETPKRKFAIDKVWGSATDLKLLDPSERAFEERPLWRGDDADKEAK
ncbi:MAG: AbrB/MazE/SpoVT family DNA-binding domain-containing protein [Pseudomonadota bacterium]